MTFKFDTFKGDAIKIDSLDISRLGHRIGVGEDEIHAFAEVEAASSGFDNQGRPKMLFEPHVFYRNLKGAEREQAVAARLAYSKWRSSGYPRDSYPRLHDAIKINQTAALKSASWGRLQVLGENFAMCGYSSPEQMVTEMMQDEENHLEAGINYIISAGIDDDLRSLAELTRPTTPEDCAPVVRVYNGPGYARHGYHIKFARAHNKWRNIEDTAWVPDVPDNEGPGIENGYKLKQAQIRLRELGYHEVGKPDGKWGTRTRAGVLAFRADRGLPIYAGIDAKFLAALMVSPPRSIDKERNDVTVKDLRKAGSRTITDANQTKQAGVGICGVAAVFGAGGIIEQLSQHVGTLNGLAGYITPAMDWASDNIPLILIILGVFIIWKSGLIQKWRLNDHKEGNHAGPTTL